MSYDAYRVRRLFRWLGWALAPTACGCGCISNCTGRSGTECQCQDAGHCACGVPSNQYGGDIWFVEAGHPRKEAMLATRFAVYDAGLVPQELLKEERFSRLVQPAQVTEQEQMVEGARRPRRKAMAASR